MQILNNNFFFKGKKHLHERIMWPYFKSYPQSLSKRDQISILNHFKKSTLLLTFCWNQLFEGSYCTSYSSMGHIDWFMRQLRLGNFEQVAQGRVSMSVGNPQRRNDDLMISVIGMPVRPTLGLITSWHNTSGARLLTPLRVGTIVTKLTRCLWSLSNQVIFVLVVFSMVVILVWICNFFVSLFGNRVMAYSMVL